MGIDIKCSLLVDIHLLITLEAGKKSKHQFDKSSFLDEVSSNFLQTANLPSKTIEGVTYCSQQHKRSVPKKANLLFSIVILRFDQRDQSRYHLADFAQ